ncbi:polysaccharide deacetylase family protein [Flavobacterium luteum]|uniref:Polysaccharide deacetylase family protein n=1 Tax=Flavobacterium luteum TaxID=2026654 RepID=A0A7J5A884_9FLAO|nr:polysaccharide deacetylase family protein [Flavobacterium luteum]KAB1153708.1 polysaccharide deacetylase family protein [Flavobacterium luteum]
MTRFNRIVIIPCFLLFCIFSISCKGTKDKIISKINTTTNQEKLDSLPLIPRHFLEQEKVSNGHCLLRGKGGNKLVALTFDDGPTNLSNKILNVLKKNSVKATFFWLGKNLAENREIISKAKKSGHQIANHSWDHTNGWNLDEQYIWEQQVAKTIEELKTVAGVQSKYYRPPFGGITQKQIDFLGSKGITTVLWSITTMDWDKTQNDGIDLENKFTSYLHPGAIVLMHDYDFGKSEQMLVALEKMIIYGKSQGYRFVTVEQIN